MKKSVSIFLLIALMFSLAACGGEQPNNEKTPAPDVNTNQPAADPVTLKVSYAESQGDPKYDAMLEFEKYVEEKSEGSISIELYASNELGSNADVCESISMGANMILSSAGDSLGDYGEPNFTAVGILYTFQSAEEVATFCESELYAEMCKNAADAGVTVLSMNWVTTPRQIMSTKELKGYDDLKGLQVRVPASTYSTFFAAAGASPVTMTFADVYAGLSSGLIEAVEAPLATLYSYSLQEVAGYVALSNHCLAPALLCMSTSVFDSLTAEQQQVLIDGSTHAGDLYTQACADTTADYRKLMEDEGVVFIDWSDEDLAKMAEAAQEVFAAYPQMDADIYDLIMAAIGKG